MHSAPRLQYLPGLDGIRAVAVSGVLLFHAGYGWASGGFLGVSAFFTLSGFLITTLVLREHGQTGAVDLKAFWAKRARRLLPALFVTAVLILFFAATAASTLQAESVARDGPWAILYAANWRFIIEGQNYADLFGGDATSPLLHLWSLAIEEQFYLALPLVAVVCARTRHFRRWLGLAALLGLAGSLAATLYHSVSDADLSRIYYGTDTRAAELLVGVAGAVFVDSRRYLLTKPVGRGVTAVGLTAMAAMAVLWISSSEQSEWLNHGGFAVHAVLTLIVILSVAPPGPLRSLFSRPWLLFVGRISYGLYLVHWPVYLWVTPDRVGFSDVRLTIVRIGLSMFLAAAAYRFVEQPIRARRVHLGPVPLGIAALLAALFATLPAAGSTETVVFEAIQPPHELVADDRSVDVAAPTTGVAPAGTEVSPAIDRRARPARVMLVGDSVMLTLGRGFERLAQDDPTLEVLNAGQIGCPVGQGGVQRIYGREVEQFEHCRHDAWDPLVESWDPDVVLMLSGVWDLKDRKLDSWTQFRAPGDPVFDQWLLTEYRAAITRLGQTGAEVVVLRPACLSRTDQNGNPIEEDEFTPGRLAAYEAAVIDELAKEVAVLDLAALVCGTGSEAVIDWEQVDGEARPDGVHFSEAGGRAVADVWVDQLLDLARARQRAAG